MKTQCNQKEKIRNKMLSGFLKKEKRKGHPFLQVDPAPTQPQGKALCAVHSLNNGAQGFCPNTLSVCGFVLHTQTSPSPRVLARVGAEAELAPRGV